MEMLNETQNLIPPHSEFLSNIKHSYGLKYGYLGYLLFSSKCILTDIQCKDRGSNEGEKKAKKYLKFFAYGSVDSNM